MKKKLFIALLTLSAALCCAFGLAACNLGGGGDSKGSDGIWYELSDDGSYAIVTYGAYKQEESVTVAATYKNKPVTTIGEGAFKQDTYLKTVTLPASITTIEYEAFRDCNKLETISFGTNSQLKTIGQWAFCSCSSLKTFTIPDGVEELGDGVFYDCSSLTNLKIPDSVTTMKAAVFTNCTSLTEITIPDTVTSMGSGMFFGCSALESLTLPYLGSNSEDTEHATLAYHAESSYSNQKLDNLKKVTVNGGVLGKNAFYSSHVETVVLKEGITSISERAFYRCHELKSVTLPSTIEEIGEYAFADSAIPSIELPETLTEIKAHTFEGCALESINIPASVTTIGDQAFYCAFNLASVTYEKDSQLTSIGRKAFSMQYEIWWDVEYFDYDSESKLTTLTVPEHVTTIGKSAFDNLTALRYLNWNAIECRDFEVHRGSIYSRTTVDGPFNKVEYATSTAGCKDGIIANFGSQVKKIPAATFYGVSNLISVSFGGGIGMLNRVCESIGDYAFYGCTGLFDLSLPVTLKTIGAYAFYECFSLINLYIPSTLTTVGNNAFYCPKLVEICNDSSITIHVGGSQTLEMNIYSSSSGSSKLFSYGMDGNDVYTFYQDGSTYYLMGTRDNTAHGLNLPQFVFKGNAKVSDTYIIHAYAFYGRNDDTIIISKPEAIAEIQSNAFNKIKNASVFFNGTAEKWNEMPRSFREALDWENTKYYYSETQPTEEGNFWRYYYGAIFIW